MIYPNERIDFIHRKGYKIIQNPQVFCFGIDAVLLADFAKVKKKDRVLDIGTGTGIIPILMFARYENKEYVGIDIQKDMIEMANRSIRMNKIENHIKMKCLRIQDIIDHYPRDSFDIVTSNPPYMKADAGVVSGNTSKMIARHEITCTLEDVIKNAAYVLRDKGSFYMIHRPHRLVDIMTLMRHYRLEPKRMQMVYPNKDKPPTMLLVEGIKYARAELVVEPPLYIYSEKGKYTNEIYEIYGMKREME